MEAQQICPSTPVLVDFPTLDGVPTLPPPAYQRVETAARNELASIEKTPAQSNVPPVRGLAPPAAAKVAAARSANPTSKWEPASEKTWADAVEMKTEEGMGQQALEATKAGLALIGEGLMKPVRAWNELPLPGKFIAAGTTVGTPLLIAGGIVVKTAVGVGFPLLGAGATAIGASLLYARDARAGLRESDLEAGDPKSEPPPAYTSDRGEMTVMPESLETDPEKKPD